MKKYFLATLTTLLIANVGFAQEEDVDLPFGYDDLGTPTEILIRTEVPTSDGFTLSNGAFMESAFGATNTQQPGFITESLDETDGIRVNANDQIFIRLLDADETTANGEGYVTFYNPVTNDLTAGGQIDIRNQAGDTISLDGTSIAGLDTILLSPASDGNQESNASDPDENVTLGPGEIHNHLTFTLQGEGGNDRGAYGIFFQLEADQAANGLNGVDTFSEPTFLLFNDGLTEPELAQAQAAFGVVAVPEPSTGIVMLAASGAILSRRRRRI